MQDPIQSEAVITGSLDIAGRRIGRFEIRRLLGSGGMGQVYLAEDTTLKRVVAIKRMAPRPQVNEEERRRFIKEAQRASALNHPSIACVYDVLEDCWSWSTWKAPPSAASCAIPFRSISSSPSPPSARKDWRPPTRQT
jgi:serine/threonine protein kinase